jgi:hypothetical protein
VQRLGEDGLRKIILDHVDATNVSVVTDLLRMASADQDVAGRGLAKAQIAALHSMVQSSPPGRLAAVRWTRLVTIDEPLILGDCCVVCVGADGSVGWPFKFGRRWKEIYLPVGRALAVVGMAADAPGAPSLDAAALNRASADLAREYVYACRCTQVELTLAARIGSMSPLIEDETIEDLVEEAVSESSLPDNKGSSRQVAKVGRNAPCPCGSGKKFKKCCWRSQ